MSLWLPWFVHVKEIVDISVQHELCVLKGRIRPWGYQISSFVSGKWLLQTRKTANHQQSTSEERPWFF